MKQKQSLFFTAVFSILFSFTSVAQDQFGSPDPYKGRTLTLNNYGMNNHVQLRQADLLFRKLDVENAFMAYESAVASGLLSAEALIRRARFKQILGMESEAQADFRRARRMNPHIGDLYGYQGQAGLLNLLAYYPEKSVIDLDLDSRISHYFNFLDSKSTQVSTELDGVFLVEEIILDLENGSYENNSQKLTELLELYPESAVGYDLLGLLHLKQEEYELAAEAFSQAVALEPEFAIAWYNMGRVSHLLGNREAARDYYDMAVSLQNDLTKAYFDRALLHKELGDPEAAIKDYNQIILLDGPEYLEAFMNRGLTRKMLGDFHGALMDIDIAIEEFPERPELYKNRGNLYLLFGDVTNAIDDYSKAIELDNQFAEAYYNRALAHLVNFDAASGCSDFGTSALLGYDRAHEQQLFFCTE